MFSNSKHLFVNFKHQNQVLNRFGNLLFNIKLQNLTSLTKQKNLKVMIFKEAQEIVSILHPEGATRRSSIKICS